MSTKRDIKDLVAVVEAAGWRVEWTKNNHIQMFSPDGEHLVTCGGTESDYRAIRNTKARLRRAGLVLVH